MSSCATGGLSKRAQLHGVSKRLQAHFLNNDECYAKQTHEIVIVFDEGPQKYGSKLKPSFSYVVVFTICLKPMCWRGKLKTCED